MGTSLTIKLIEIMLEDIKDEAKQDQCSKGMMKALLPLYNVSDAELDSLLREYKPSASAIRHDPDRPKTGQDLAAIKRAEEKRARKAHKKTIKVTGNYV
jgi:hypothetical protein